MFYFAEIIKNLREELKIRGIKLKDEKSFTEGKSFFDQDSGEFLISYPSFKKHFLYLYKKWIEFGADHSLVLIFDEMDKLFPDLPVDKRKKALSEYIELFGQLRSLSLTLESHSSPGSRILFPQPCSSLGIQPAVSIWQELSHNRSPDSKSVL